jgi:hypothetical protein
MQHQEGQGAGWTRQGDAECTICLAQRRCCGQGLQSGRRNAVRWLLRSLASTPVFVRRGRSGRPCGAGLCRHAGLCGSQSGAVLATARRSHAASRTSCSGLPMSAMMVHKASHVNCRMLQRSSSKSRKRTGACWSAAGLRAADEGGAVVGGGGVGETTASKPQG